MMFRVLNNDKPVMAKLTFYPGSPDEEIRDFFTFPNGIMDGQLPRSWSGHIVKVTPLQAGVWGTIFSFVPSYGIIDIIDCPSLPRPEEGWWRRFLGTKRSKAAASIKIGIADNGTCSNIIVEKNVNVFGNQSICDCPEKITHGESVISVIKEVILASNSPPVRVIFASAVRESDGEATQTSVANAIRALVDDGEVDIISVSIGDSALPTIGIQTAIKYAFDAGIICFFAAGNMGGCVNFPARYREAVSVGAVGCSTWGPPGTVTNVDSLIATCHGNEGLFLWHMSASGRELDVIAPGVGLVVEVRHNEIIHLTGTSFSAPFAASILAICLSEDKNFPEMPRNHTRARWALAKLEEICSLAGFPSGDVRLGFPSELEGWHGR